MTYFRVRRGEVVLGRVVYSGSLWFRMKGLLGRTHLAEGEGILLAPCNSIHMFFMKFPIDAIFLDGEDRVVVIYPVLKPWRLSGIHAGARKVIELPAGTAERCGVSVGDTLQMDRES